jgi:excisionase family DNA binding protein
MQSPTDLYTTSSAARFLERSEATIRELARRGVLPFVQTTGRMRLFRREDLETYRSSQA